MRTCTKPFLQLAFTTRTLSLLSSPTGRLLLTGGGGRVFCSVCHPGRGLWWHFVHLRKRLFEMQGIDRANRSSVLRVREEEREEGEKHVQFSLPASATWNWTCITINTFGSFMAKGWPADILPVSCQFWQQKRSIKFAEIIPVSSSDKGWVWLSFGFLPPSD